MALEQALLELQRLTERLRRECPWDREQTARTIVPHTVAEAYEVADAALAGDGEKLLDELGDLLFQCVFLALTLQENAKGDLETVIRGVTAKLIRRHPHIFGEADDPSSAHAQRGRWERIKREQEGREGVFHDVAESLPALLYARKVQRRAAAVNFDYPDAEAAAGDLADELAELKTELERGTPARETEPDGRQAEEPGDLLFAVVNVARHLNVDPELELRRAVQRFRERVEVAEALAKVK